MIIWVALICLLAVRIIVRVFYFSPMNLLLLLAYLISLITVSGKVKWSLLWVIGTSLASILCFFVFKSEPPYVLALDLVLLALGLLGFFFEKKLS